MNIWIVGAGGIAQEYAKVLSALGHEFTVIGRGEESAKIFEERTGICPIVGGLEAFLNTSPEIPDKVINCVRACDLGKTNIRLASYGVNSILSEKPGFLPNELDRILKVAHDCSTKIFIAYNRRFYSSVLAAEKIIEDDGGLLSFNFEFTEWRHVIEASATIPEIEKRNLFFTNSSHVVDLAFFLGGTPTQMDCYTAGELNWHKPAIFAGSGVTDKGALFSYQANWAAPGRWSVEMLTSKHRLIFRPMEQLQIQNIGSVAINPVEIDDHLDKEFKPGFYLQTKAYLLGDDNRLCSIEEQFSHITEIYKRING